MSDKLSATQSIEVHVPSSCSSERCAYLIPTKKSYTKRMENFLEIIFMCGETCKLIVTELSSQTRYKCIAD